MVVKYIAFCLTAMVANLGVQCVFREWLGQPLLVSLVMGTAIGLVIKYALDRNFIFNGRGVGLRRDVRRFMLYSVFGLITTMLFWLVEWTATKVSSHPAALYVGGGVGLVLGYSLKYALDRRWVFEGVTSSGS